MQLTDIVCRNLKPPDKGQVTHFDDQLAGFALRVSQGGTKTFVLVHGRQRQKTTIGRYPIISLSEARGAAKRILAERTLGKHQVRSMNVLDAVTTFLGDVRKRNKPRTHYDYSRILNRYLVPPFKLDRLADLGTTVIMDRLEALSDTPAEQNYAFRVFRIFFKWAVRKNYLDRNPLEAMRLPNKLSGRARILTDNELAKIWNGCEGHYNTSTQFRAIVRMLILTGQRRGEIAALKLPYFNRVEKLCTLPPHLTKNGLEHVFAYGDWLDSILDTNPTNYEYLFPATGKDGAKMASHFNAWSKSKVELDQRSGVTGWTLHDLRRTFSTRLADLDVEPHIIERLINHISGEVSGVAAIYNRSKYIPKMRAAIALWEQYLSTILAKAV